MMRTLNQILTWYDYNLVGSGVWGRTNDLSYLCEIYDENGNELFYNETTPEECENAILSYIKCDGGICRDV